MAKKLPENRVRGGTTSEKGNHNNTDGTTKISFIGRAQVQALQTCQWPGNLPGQHQGRNIFPSGVDENITGETENSARIYLEQQRLGVKGDSYSTWDRKVANT